MRDMLIAKQFGQGGPVSAYTSAFNLPDLLYFFLSSGALSSAFIPVFTEAVPNRPRKRSLADFQHHRMSYGIGAYGCYSHLLDLCKTARKRAGGSGIC